jgi:hypothetical protein
LRCEPSLKSASTYHLSTSLLLLTNGSSILPATRQRPQLVLEDATKRPLWLFNGAALYGRGNGDLTHLTHTLAFQFK